MFIFNLFSLEDFVEFPLFNLLKLQFSMNYCLSLFHLIFFYCLGLQFFNEDQKLLNLMYWFRPPYDLYQSSTLILFPALSESWISKFNFIELEFQFGSDSFLSFMSFGLVAHYELSHFLQFIFHVLQTIILDLVSVIKFSFSFVL